MTERCDVCNCEIVDDDCPDNVGYCPLCRVRDVVDRYRRALERIANYERQTGDKDDWDMYWACTEIARKALANILYE